MFLLWCHWPPKSWKLNFLSSNQDEFQLNKKGDASIQSKQKGGNEHQQKGNSKQNSTSESDGDEHYSQKAKSCQEQEQFDYVIEDDFVHDNNSADWDGEDFYMLLGIFPKSVIKNPTKSDSSPLVYYSEYIQKIIKDWKKEKRNIAHPKEILIWKS